MITDPENASLPPVNEANSDHWICPFQVMEFKSGLVLKRGSHQVFLPDGQHLLPLLETIQSRSLEMVSRLELENQLPTGLRSFWPALREKLSETGILLARGDNRISEVSKEGPEDVYYWEMGTTRQKVLAAVARTGLVVIGLNRLSLQLIRALVEAGVEGVGLIDDPFLRSELLEIPNDWGDSSGILPPGTSIQQLESSQAQVVVPVLEFGGQSRLLNYNQHVLDSGKKCYPVYLENGIGHLGPMVEPGKGPCLECLRIRQNANIDEAHKIRAFEAHAGEGQPTTAIHPSACSMLAHLACLELLRYFAVPDNSVSGKWIEVGLPTARTTAHNILRLPNCPACGHFPWDHT